MRFLLTALVRLLEIALGVLSVGAFVYPSVAGYYLRACGENGGGWALLTMLLVPFGIPAVGFLWLSAGITLGIASRPFHAGTTFWSLAKWAVVISIVFGLIAFGIASVYQAHAKCDIGF